MTGGLVRQTAAILVVAAWLVWLASPGGMSWADGAPWLVLTVALATLRFAAGWMLRVLGVLVAVVLVTWPIFFEPFGESQSYSRFWLGSVITQTTRYSELYPYGITMHAVAVPVVHAPQLIVTGLVLACGLVLALFPAGAAGNRVIAVLVLLAVVLVAVGTLSWWPSWLMVVVGALVLATGFGAVTAAGRVRRALGAVAVAEALAVLYVTTDGADWLPPAEQYHYLGQFAARATLTGAAALFVVGALVIVCGHQLPRLSWRRGG